MDNNLKYSVSLSEQASQEAQRTLMSVLSCVLYKRRIKCSDDDLEELYDLGLVASFDGCQSFSLGSCAEKCKRKLYTYLLRKFTDDEYMDEDGVFHKYPHGAEFFGATDALGSSCLSVRFPDDDITALLDEYGANRCKEWGA